MFLMGGGLALGYGGNLFSFLALVPPPHLLRRIADLFHLPGEVRLGNTAEDDVA